MSAYDLQDTPAAVLSFFRLTPRPRRQPGKAGNHCGRNYTLKLPLSLIITMHYAAVRNCRKRGFRGLPGGCPNRPGADRLTPGRPTLLPAAGALDVRPEELRSHRGRPWFPEMKRSEFVVQQARRNWVQERGSTAPCSRLGP